MAIRIRMPTTSCNDKPNSVLENTIGFSEWSYRKRALTHTHGKQNGLFFEMYSISMPVFVPTQAHRAREEKKKMETQVQHRANIYKHQTEIREVENVGLVINSLKIKYFTLTHFFLYSFVFVLPWLLLLLLRSYFVWFLAKLHSQ